MIYALGLQAWPVYLCSWWLSYYSWFSSVYYTMLATQPFLYARLIQLRGQRRALLALTALVVLLNYCVVGGWVVLWLAQRESDGDLGLARDANAAAELTGQLSLGYYLFPLFWWPSFACGTMAAFLFDCFRPYLSHRAHLWGHLCDLISLALLALIGCSIAFASCQQKYGHRCPSDLKASHDNVGLEALLGVAEDDAFGSRVLAGIVSRTVMPLMVLWLYAMAVGRGVTCWLFSRPIFVDVLAPVSYSLYLWHQWVGQIYYLLTRYEWWSYWRFRKAFFWFSPAPVPVAWQEYFFVVVLTTALGLALGKIDPWLVSLWEGARRSLRRCRCGGGTGTLAEGGRSKEARERDTLSIVLDEIELLTGMAVEPCWSLAECGLASVAAPVVRGRLARALPGINLALDELVKANTIASLSQLCDKRRKEAMAAGV